MKNLEKHAVTVGVIVIGILVAGYAMNALKDNAYIADARKGFGATA